MLSSSLTLNGNRLDIQASMDLEGLKKFQTVLKKYQEILEELQLEIDKGVQTANPY
jgi:hypothetical protein